MRRRRRGCLLRQRASCIPWLLALTLDLAVASSSPAPNERTTLHEGIPTIAAAATETAPDEAQTGEIPGRTLTRHLSSVSNFQTTVFPTDKAQPTDTASATHVRQNGVPPTEQTAATQWTQAGSSRETTRGDTYRTRTEQVTDIPRDLTDTSVPRLLSANSTEKEEQTPRTANTLRTEPSVFAEPAQTPSKPAGTTDEQLVSPDSERTEQTNSQTSFAYKQTEQMSATSSIGIIPTGDQQKATSGNPMADDVSVNTVRLRLAFDADYDACVRGRQWQFLAHMRRQMSALLRVPMNGIRNIYISPGSILLTLDLVPVRTPELELTREDLEAARADLLARVNRGVVNISDLDGRRLPIFTTATTTAAASFSGRGNVIVIIVAVIGAIFVCTVLLLCIVLYLQKQATPVAKVSPTHQTYLNGKSSRINSFSGLVPGKALLSCHLDRHEVRELLARLIQRGGSTQGAARYKGPADGPPVHCQDKACQRSSGSTLQEKENSLRDSSATTCSGVYPTTSTPATDASSVAHWTNANSVTPPKREQTRQRIGTL